MGRELTAPRITLDAVVTLAPQRAVGREELEVATMDVQEKLDAHANDIADGASASANFETGCVEIDLTIEGYSVGELYQRIGVVIDRLARHCEIDIAADELVDSTGTLGVRSVASQTSFAVVVA
jgi:hypothetical protein